MSALEENQEWGAVNRIVFPTTDAESTLPLYVVNWTPSHPDSALFDARESLEKVAFSSLSKRQLSGTLRNGIFSAQEASKTELPAGSVLLSLELQLSWQQVSTSHCALSLTHFRQVTGNAGPKLPMYVLLRKLAASDVSSS